MLNAETLSEKAWSQSSNHVCQILIDNPCTVLWVRIHHSLIQLLHVHLILGWYMKLSKTLLIVKTHMVFSNTKVQCSQTFLSGNTTVKPSSLNYTGTSVTVHSASKARLNPDKRPVTSARPLRVVSVYLRVSSPVERGGRRCGRGRNARVLKQDHQAVVGWGFGIQRHHPVKRECIRSFILLDCCSRCFIENAVRRDICISYSHKCLYIKFGWWNNLNEFIPSFLSSPDL